MGPKGLGGPNPGLRTTRFGLLKHKHFQGRKTRLFATLQLAVVTAEHPLLQRKELCNVEEEMGLESGHANVIHQPELRLGR